MEFLEDAQVLACATLKMTIWIAVEESQKMAVWMNALISWIWHIDDFKTELFPQLLFL